LLLLYLSILRLLTVGTIPLTLVTPISTLCLDFYLTLVYDDDGIFLFEFVFGVGVEVGVGDGD